MSQSEVCDKCSWTRKNVCTCEEWDECDRWHAMYQGERDPEGLVLWDAAFGSRPYSVVAILKFADWLDANDYPTYAGMVRNHAKAIALEQGEGCYVI